ncbi:hypothetical protein DesyoDRAFT_4212 [Desulfosporosinus youngiae DSM 17734]|uniref:Uncharacterized protein n=1 Tax=Desulfosporosinus youngiae DSM 17734 TaxID=768710 RepID=H5XXG4_9FIRM|nr:hypothetical protein DesyoDRAFT_4212 [Desulfosporosinus youngiae DSM 17734]
MPLCGTINSLVGMSKNICRDLQLFTKVVVNTLSNYEMKVLAGKYENFPETLKDQVAFLEQRLNYWMPGRRKS